MSVGEEATTVKGGKLAAWPALTEFAVVLECYSGGRKGVPRTVDDPDVESDDPMDHTFVVLGFAKCCMGMKLKIRGRRRIFTRRRGCLFVWSVLVSVYVNVRLYVIWCRLLVLLLYGKWSLSLCLVRLNPFWIGRFRLRCVTLIGVPNYRVLFIGTVLVLLCRFLPTETSLIVRRLCRCRWSVRVLRALTWCLMFMGLSVLGDAVMVIGCCVTNDLVSGSIVVRGVRVRNLYNLILNRCLLNLLLISC